MLAQRKADESRRPGALMVKAPMRTHLLLFSFCLGAIFTASCLKPVQDPAPGSTGGAGQTGGAGGSGGVNGTGGNTATGGTTSTGGATSTGATGGAGTGGNASGGATGGGGSVSSACDATSCPTGCCDANGGCVTEES